MSEPKIPSRRQFFRRIIQLNLWMSIPVFLVMSASLSIFLELTRAQWFSFVGFAAVYCMFVSPITMHVLRRLALPVEEWLDGVGDARKAFTAVMNLGLHAGALAVVSCVVATVLVSTLMALRYETWGAFESLVTVSAGLSAGFLVGALTGLIMKVRVADVREAIARTISNPQERSQYGYRIPVRRKLLMAVLGVAMVPFVTSVLLSVRHATTSADEVAIQWQSQLLDALPAEPNGSHVASILASLNSVPLPLPVQIDRLMALEQSGRMSPEVVHAVRAEAQRGIASGDSHRLPGNSTFVWRMFGDAGIWVASSPHAAVRRAAPGAFWIFVVILVLSAIFASVVAHCLATEVASATERLCAETERMAKGDLRPGLIWESEDELGDLSRAFEAMGNGLRETLGRVAEAAERVEASASAINPASRSITSVSDEQVGAMESAATSMAEIDAQVRGIAASSTSLNESVEASSSSVLELGASGQQLNQTAAQLLKSVQETSQSIGELTRSVSLVTDSTESLSEAAEETSASMEEMASSLREVDRSAEETSRLSAEVVDRAETGQQKVRETIVGMEAIQQVTETAEDVIRGLRGRTVEIGAIVDVIDDVADETNLLALNAAIIAAQSGEQGRAFGVVADEIKDLAERVLSSTKEIGSLISAVQVESGRATAAIEEGTASVANGVERSAEAGMALEAITRASRESGARMQGIVGAVQAQSQAAVHVVGLMEKVRVGVDQIRQAANEQDRGHAVVSASSSTMADVAQQVSGTTEEQARGASHIRESIEGVRIVVNQIHRSLHEQAQASASVLGTLESVRERTHVNEEATNTLDNVTKVLVENAEGLRQEVARFQL